MTVTEKETQSILALQRVTEALNIATQERDALRFAAQAGLEADMRLEAARFFEDVA
jgi:hypothetical protein